LVEQKSLQCSGNFAYLTTGSHSLALEEHSVFAVILLKTIICQYFYISVNLV